MGFAGGALACGEACAFDTSACHHCGDGVIDPDEACDGDAPRPCAPGLVGEIRCEACGWVEACAPAPDAGPADAGPPDASDGGSDARLGDARLDAESDQGAPDAMDADAIPRDASAADMAALDAVGLDAAPDPAVDGAVVDGGEADARPPASMESGGDCDVSPGRPSRGGWPLAALLACLALRRRG